MNTKKLFIAALLFGVLIGTQSTHCMRQEEQILWDIDTRDGNNDEPIAIASQKLLEDKLSGKWIEYGSKEDKGKYKIGFYFSFDSSPDRHFATNLSLFRKFRKKVDMVVIIFNRNARYSATKGKMNILNLPNEWLNEGLKKTDLVINLYFRRKDGKWIYQDISKSKESMAALIQYLRENKLKIKPKGTQEIQEIVNKEIDVLVERYGRKAVVNSLRRLTKK